MKTIDEIMKVTECTLEQAEKLHNELIKLPEKTGKFYVRSFRYRKCI